jgi:hypothetical protein
MSEIIKIGVRSLEILFFAGWAGSLIVLLLSGFEDIRTAFDSEPTETH